MFSQFFNKWISFVLLLIILELCHTNSNYIPGEFMERQMRYSLMNIIKIQYFIFNSLNYINLVNFRDQSCVSDIISENGENLFLWLGLCIDKL